MLALGQVFLLVYAHTLNNLFKRNKERVIMIRLSFLLLIKGILYSSFCSASLQLQYLALQQHATTITVSSRSIEELKHPLKLCLGESFKESEEELWHDLLHLVRLKFIHPLILQEKMNDKWSITRILSSIVRLNWSHTIRAPLPSSIKILTYLKMLNCTNIYLERVPCEIGSLVNLTHLYLSKNCLSTLPSSISNCLHLSLLAIDNNEFNILPVEIISLPELRDLYCESNPFIVLPPQLIKMPCLQKVKISDYSSENKERVVIIKPKHV
jgi:hypothetical protein